jgi:hypothetical protein
VAPVSMLVRDPDRTAVMSYVSEDDGVSWTHGNIIDLGGHGSTATSSTLAGMVTTTAPWSPPWPSSETVAF